MSRVSTHSLGAMCQTCRAVLVPDDCCPGQPHGYGFTAPSAWAAATWPDHPCFTDPHPTDTTQEAHRG